MPAADVCLKRQIGDYFLEESDEYKLGEGAFGTVYRAEHIHSAIPVAVKKLAKEKTKFDELKAVSQLENENVIGVIDLHRDDQEIDNRSYVFIILELCDIDLHAHLKNQIDRKLNHLDLDTVTECVAKGYKALYDRSIIHRDIKPENILLKYALDGRVRTAKIGDFGASRLMESEDENERKLMSLAGTPLYMAPEIGANIVADRRYDAKVDMWSMGVVLYECIYGQVPFDERALCRLFLFSANGNYEGYTGPPSTTDWSTISLSYQALINRLLELDVQERLSPSDFYCWIVHQKLLIDENSVMEIQRKHSLNGTSINKRRRFRLRGTNECCSIKDGRKPKWHKYIENNNNYQNENKNSQNCDQCMNGHDQCNGENFHSGGQGENIVGDKSVYAFVERCFWFSGMFVACNYCCFSMRQYGYDN